MPKDKLEALGNTQATRRTVLKGLLVGLGAGVLVQAAGGVTALARSEQEKGTDQKVEKKGVKKGEEPKKDEPKSEKAKTDSKKKSKKKGEEPKKDAGKDE